MLYVLSKSLLTLSLSESVSIGFLSTPKDLKSEFLCIGKNMSVNTMLQSLLT